MDITTNKLKFTNRMAYSFRNLDKLIAMIVAIFRLIFRANV